MQYFSFSGNHEKWRWIFWNYNSANKGWYTFVNFELGVNYDLSSWFETLDDICTPDESFIKLKLRDCWMNKLKSAKPMKVSRKVIMPFKPNSKLSFALGSWVTRFDFRIDAFYYRWLKIYHFHKGDESV